MPGILNGQRTDGKKKKVKHYPHNWRLFDRLRESTLVWARLEYEWWLNSTEQEALWSFVFRQCCLTSESPFRSASPFISRFSEAILLITCFIFRIGRSFVVRTSERKPEVQLESLGTVCTQRTVTTEWSPPDYRPYDMRRLPSQSSALLGEVWTGCVY